MDYKTIRYDVQGRVLLVTLDQPDQRNAMGPVMERELRTAVEAGDRDPEVRAIVLTGAGSAFCVGADMAVLDAVGGSIQLPSLASVPAFDEDDFEANYQRRFTYLLRIGTPLIAALNGAVAGVGFSVSLFCDFRFMVDSANMSTAFSRRGLIAEHGTSWMLSRLIGPMNAMDLLLTGRKVSGAEAERLGLVRALPADGFLNQVRAFADDIAENASPRSTAIMKRLVYDALMQPLGQACMLAEREEILSFSSEDFAEGVAHFMQRRPPRFTGC